MNSTLLLVTFLIPLQSYLVVYQIDYYQSLPPIVSTRLLELLDEINITSYKLYILSGVPKSTISNILNCNYESVKLRIILEICQGLEINISDFFNSPLFYLENIDPE